MLAIGAGVALPTNLLEETDDPGSPISETAGTRYKQILFQEHSHPAVKTVAQILALKLAIPAGTETEYVRPRSGPFHPEFFSPEEFETIRPLVEIVLRGNLNSAGPKPAPGGPSTIYDEVAEWIDLVAASAPGVRKLATDLPPDQRALAVAYFGSENPVRDLETCEPETNLREGFDWLAKMAHERFGRNFMLISRDEQLDLVSSISDSRASKFRATAGRHILIC